MTIKEADITSEESAVQALANSRSSGGPSTIVLPSHRPALRADTACSA